MASEKRWALVAVPRRFTYDWMIRLLSRKDFTMNDLFKWLLFRDLSPREQMAMQTSEE